MSLRKYFLLIFFAVPSFTNGQEIVSTDWFIWLRYYNQARFNERVILHTEIDNRWFSNPWRQSQFFTHIHIHNRIKPWLDVAAAFNFNLTNSPANTSVSVPELRPWQEVTFFPAIGKKWQFQFRYRLDERFIHNHSSTELTDGYHFNLRHRFRIQASTALAKFNNYRLLTLKIFNEIMLNTGDVPRTFDQNRLGASLEYQFNKHWSLESGYINILQPKTDTEYFDRNVIRTTVYHRIGK